ncbi:MAG: hypothetical protein LBB26_04385 [Puniceicoccales bacterium]|jgi:hypothetical protein|nr:hypothetical protein [Puniceicoccales bacterium]
MKFFIGNYCLAGGQDADEEPFDLVLETAGIIQIAMSLRAAVAKPIDRRNRTTNLQFSLRRKHVSVEQSSEFLLTHAATLTGVTGNFRIVGEGDLPPSYILGDSTIRRIRGAQEGIATVHHYEIIGGALVAIPQEDQ